MRNTRMMFGIVALTLASTSCLRQKAQPRAFTPPPTRQWPPVDDQAPTLPEAPPIAIDEASIIPPQLPQMSPDTLPEVPEAPKRVVRRPSPPVTQPKPAIGPPGESPTTAPRLAQMLTAEELRENTRTLNESLERVNRVLATIEGKNLTAEQKETAERIRTFRKQAEQVRDQDLLTAVSLARRADLLAKDLFEHLP